MGMFNGMMAGPSLADIAAVTRNNNNNDGFGNGWWAWILMWAMMGGWGMNGFGWGMNGMGWGMNGMNGLGFAEGALQRGFDNQTVLNKLEGIQNGISSLGYDQLAQMNGIQNTVMQTGYGLQGSINQLGINNMQDTFGLQQAINNGFSALSRQQAECCCENRAAIAQVRYDMATDTCALKTQVHETGDAIMQNQNAGFQMLNNTLRDGFCSLEMREMQRENQALRDRLNTCDRDSALLAQSNYLIDRLQPCSRPAYLTCNPNTGLTWPLGMYANNGCCNNGFFNNGCCNNGCNSCCG